jgi:hypothetical protein
MIQDTLKERQSTHGSFEENAHYSQCLKHVMHKAPNWEKLSPVQREALDMIALKLSRILTGDPTHKDAWHDLAGYATLAENELID